MADCLRRLANGSVCTLMQEKLDDWYLNYDSNSCDENLTLCCDLMELSAKVQGQLISVLTATAREGGRFAGAETLKNRFLPIVGSCFSTTSFSRAPDSSVSLLQETMVKDRKLREQANCHEQEVQKLEAQLNSARLELGALKQELSEAHMEMQDTKNQSATTLLASEDEIMHLKSELARSRSPSPNRHGSRSSSPHHMKSESPTLAMLTNSSRHARLVSRFSDIYANDRLDAQNLLRRYIDDLEMVQRILYIATTESFHAAKTAYRQFKLRVRKTLSPAHDGPECLEDAVLDYIVRNLELYDVQASVCDVIRAMNVNPKISFPPEVDFILISSFIREVCRVAFAMQTLDEPVDIAFASDGELYNENKYHRNFDSDFTAPLVVYHVWPALMENDTVLVKGEVVTKRGALWSPGKTRGRSRTSSTSPVRSRSASPCCTMASRSRSPSPLRRRM